MRVATFYHFFKVLDVEQAKTDLESLAKEFDIRGLVILASEGLNTTVAGSDENLELFLDKLHVHFNWDKKLFVKFSPVDQYPFKIFKVKVRDEVVTTTRPDLKPSDQEMRDATHLSPQQWNDVLKNESDVFLVDTRNWYETQVGTFKGAVDPKISEFTQFTEYIESQNLPKDQKILMFCTGGIRCEKGILDLKDRGYTEVYQLEGGILNYLKECPNDLFEGECFVFDHRVAVQQDLSPSTTYGLCPHCGQPATISIDCSRCDHPTIICHECHTAQKSAALTCSKNCAYHWNRRPGVKGPRQIPGFQNRDLAELRRIKNLKRLETRKSGAPHGE